MGKMDELNRYLERLPSPGGAVRGLRVSLLRACFLAVLFLFACRAHATISIVQSVANTACSTGTGCAVTVASTGAGHLIHVAAIFTSSSNSISLVSGVVPTRIAWTAALHSWGYFVNWHCRGG